MKILRLILMLICAAVLKNVNAQVKIKADSNFKFFSDKLNRSFDISLPDFKIVGFQVRLYVLNFNGYAHQLFILNYYKNGLWTGIKYTFCSDKMIKFENKRSTVVHLSSRWLNEWNALLSDSVETLPTEQSVMRNWISSTNRLPAFTEGVAYRIELVSKESSHGFTYSNPEDTIGILDLNNDELKEMVKIVDILNSELNFKTDIPRCY